MADQIKRYLVAKVIKDFRAYPDKRLDEDLARSINSEEYVADLRRQIAKADIGLFAQIVKDESGAVGTLALTLLKDVVHEPEASEFVLGLWPPDATASFRRKVGIVSRLLDVEGLDTKIHEQLYAFVRDNLRTFLDWLTPWWGGLDKIMPVCKARLEDPRFPKAKHWLYLCCALDSPDKAAVKSLLMSYQSSSDLFIARVAGEMLTELPIFPAFTPGSTDGQSDTISSYLATHVIQDIRDGQLLSDGLAVDLDSAPYVRPLRNVVKESDIDILLAMAKTQSESCGLLAITMLKNFVNESKVEKALREMWQNESRFRTKVGVTFRLVDIEGLELAMHEELYAFIKQNLRPFVEWLTKWAGGPNHVYPHCESRLNDPTFTESKNWLYLCRLLGSSDKAKVAALLKRYEASTNSFIAKVAKEMLAELPDF